MVRTLSFYNLHTEESLTAAYWANGRYVGSELARIDHILRDFRQNETKPIDPRLFDLLYMLGHKLRTRGPFEVISGYRSPKTNAMLVENTIGVSPHSLHMQGKAIDIRLPDRSLVGLWQTALAMRGGGVGFYPQSEFVHVDVGRVRHWELTEATPPWAAARSTRFRIPPLKPALEGCATCG